MLKRLYDPHAKADFFEQAYAHAQNLIEKENPEKAISQYEKLLETHPERAILYGDLGVLHHSRQDKERAGLCYERAVSLQPENVTFRKNLAGFYFSELGRADDAIQIYLDLLKARPNDVETLLILGNICALAGRSDKAKFFYHKVLAVAPAIRTRGKTLKSCKIRKGDRGESSKRALDSSLSSTIPSHSGKRPVVGKRVHGVDQRRKGKAPVLRALPTPQAGGTRVLRSAAT